MPSTTHEIRHLHRLAKKIGGGRDCYDEMSALCQDSLTGSSIINNTNAMADVCIRLFFSDRFCIHIFMYVIVCLCVCLCVYLSVCDCVCLSVCVCGWLYRTSISSNWPLKVPESAFAPMMMAPAASGGDAAPAAEEKDSFDVVLTAAGGNKIGVIKVARWRCLHPISAWQRPRAFREARRPGA